jgi:hypothetical protein
VDRTASTVRTGPRFGQRERVHQVGDHERDPVTEGFEPPPRLIDHRRRAVERDDPAAGEPSREQLGDPSRTAPGVHDGLVARELEPVYDAGAPSDLRVGDPVVGLGVPVARHGLGRYRPSSEKCM